MDEVDRGAKKNWYLAWGQTLSIGVLDKALRLGTKIVLDKMGKRARAEAKRNALSFDVLLTDTRNDLRNVHLTAFAAGRCHQFEVVEARQALVCVLSCIFTSLVQLDERRETEKISITNTARNKLV